MDIRQITPTYAVSPQIAPDDCAAIADAGFKAIICNRPDMEITPDCQAAAIEAAAKAVGLGFTVLPLTHQTMNAENVAAHRAAIDAAGGPVLAYCASGTRSSIAWSLGLAGDMASDDIIEATGKAGYDLRGLHPQLEMIAAQKS
ncbi:TIGR01244 family phosphatase [Rhodobacteraceae bacterium S2214]|nr:TIGR01244 family phosphatase [Rhodobacteraceae bacterium S2214]